MSAFNTAARRATALAGLNALLGRELRGFGFTAYAAGVIPQDGAGKPDAEHVECAKRRLGAVTRAQAIAQALGQGLIAASGK